MSVWKQYGYGWITLAFFLFSLLLHPIFGWAAFRNEAAQNSRTPQWNAFMIAWGREVF